MDVGGLGGFLLGVAALITALGSARSSRRRTNANRAELARLRKQLQRVLEAVADMSRSGQTEFARAMDTEVLEEIRQDIREGRKRHR